jgi:RNA polymerase sigma factor (sigma-70 family)
MQQVAGPPLTDGQQQLILSCDQPVRNLAYKHSCNSRLVDFDEMYSIGILAVCEKAGRAIEQARSPFAYLISSAHYAMLEELRQRCQHATVSLDDPFSDDNSFCLLDRIAASAFVPTSNTSSSKQTQALHRAIERLASSRQREVLELLYSIDDHGCGVLSNAYKEIGHDLGISEGTVGYYASMARQSLRADVELCEAVGVEPEPSAMKPDKAPPPPEVKYAKELAAWKAGHKSYASVAKALGVSRAMARGRIATLRKAGLISEPEAPPPPEVKYAKELAAWKAGHKSYASLAKVVGIPRWQAQWRITMMRKAGLIPMRDVTEGVPA